VLSPFFQETCELQPENILLLNYTGHTREMGEYPVKISNGNQDILLRDPPQSKIAGINKDPDRQAGKMSALSESRAGHPAFFTSMTARCHVG
jgi:hypothetical protein